MLASRSASLASASFPQLSSATLSDVTIATPPRRMQGDYSKRGRLTIPAQSRERRRRAAQRGAPGCLGSEKHLQGAVLALRHEGVAARRLGERQDVAGQRRR